MAVSPCCFPSNISNSPVKIVPSFNSFCGQLQPSSRKLWSGLSSAGMTSCDKLWQTPNPIPSANLQELKHSREMNTSRNYILHQSPSYASGSFKNPWGHWVLLNWFETLSAKQRVPPPEFSATSGLNYDHMRCLIKSIKFKDSHKHSACGTSANPKNWSIFSTQKYLKATKLSTFQWPRPAPKIQNVLSLPGYARMHSSSNRRCRRFPSAPPWRCRWIHSKHPRRSLGQGSMGNGLFFTGF